MFSGLKSILFGYSDPVETPPNPETLKTEDSVLSNGTSGSLSTETSALLEQTLNAATTKLTEQLLPTSPSIEQLQSSSRQLLPTLNEQHEEDEKRKQVNELAEDKEVNDEDDDECFIADSWELLDLNDSEPKETVSANSAVQNEDSSISNVKNTTTKTSGILKQSKTRKNQPPEASGANQQQRQKPKVSFETPDLVKKEQKIELTTPNEESSTKSNKSKSKNKRNKQAKAAATVEKEPVDDEVEKPAQTSYDGTFPNLEKAPKVGQKSKAAPVLNYTAALQKKLELLKSMYEADCLMKQESSVASDTGREGGDQKKTQANGGIKRNRPMSTSSWSSSDEIEAIDLVWNDESPSVADNQQRESIDDGVVVNNNDDNESLISSGFSDCDYGYHGLNDFIMRPKKSQNKRRGVSATSNGLLSSMAKRGSERVAAETTSSKKLVETSAHKLQQEQKSANGGKWKWASTAKQTKPKKKKMILSGPAPTALASPSSTSSPMASTGLVVPKSPETVASSSSNGFLKPPSPLSCSTNNLVASSVSGNDSSDVAEMDESWYVTPPPCFTGSNKLDKSKPAKAKEAARENALIEHPSIYIAGTSKQQLANKASCSAPTKLVEAKKSSSKQSDLATENGKGKGKKKSEKSSIVGKNDDDEPKGKKSENKFVVANWPSDEQDDMDDDFDNMFEPVDYAFKPTCNNKSKKKKKAKQQQKKPQAKQSADDSPRSDSPSLVENLSAGYESDVSIKLPTPTDGSADDWSDVAAESQLVSNAELTEAEVVVVQDENLAPLAVAHPPRRRTKSEGEKRAPVAVEPIQPERLPGWQLRKKRNKRRPLANTATSVGGGNGKTSPKPAAVNQSDSGASSSRSSPNLIDRIGHSIVANLTNLTSGFSSTAQPTMPLQSQAVIEEVEKLSQAVGRKTGGESSLVARRRMSKSYLDRQNDCVKVANSSRRANRRLKMHSTPNGVSVNRKVHTNIH